MTAVAHDATMNPVDSVERPTTSTVTEPPLIDFDWESLAEAWASTNRDTDTAYRPMPSLDTLGPPAGTSTTTISTDTTLQPVLDQLEDSWSSIANELEEANREAEGTFRVLQEMEDEMNRLIEELAAKEASYQQRMQQLQEEAAKKEKHLQWQLETLESEYVAFKHDARERHLATVREAEESQLKLQNKIAELKTSLEEKINLARQESQLAQKYLHQLQEAESRYTLAKTEYKDQIQQTIIRLKPSTERLEKLRGLTDALRGVSRGSNSIMARIRQKLAGNY
jgi:chromosome segregation ATPase